MVDATHISYAANDRSYFSLLKKDIHRRAEEAGINADKLNSIDLILAEMTSNLFKYGEDGEILMGIFNNGGSPYIELISVDKGPGMSHPARMLQDGFSTGNTMGLGLGSIKRLSDTFDLYSQPGWGTIVLSRLYNNRASVTAHNVTVRPIVLAKPGETRSGDALSIRKTDKYIKVMLADGLGHGPEANAAVNEAADAFKICPDYSPSDTLRFIHQLTRKTRGAVINVLAYDFASKLWSAAGVGNISSRLIGPHSSRTHLSYNGIVGHNIPTSLSDQQYEGSDFNMVLLCSDGIKTPYDMLRYPMVNKHDPGILAAAIYKDYARRTDDMSVIVVKVN